MSNLRALTAAFVIYVFILLANDQSADSGFHFNSVNTGVDMQAYG